MSLILMIFYWLVMPISLVVSACWLFRHTSGPFGKSFVIVAAIGLLSWFFWEAAGKKMYWDAKVRELCAKDGGIRVYETVELPAESFDQWGNVGVSEKRYAEQTDEFYYETITSVLKSDEPQVIKTTTKMIRRKDGKVLGELIRFGRGGGDLPGPWYPSTYSCPPIKQNQPGLEKSVFRKGDNR
ncbi:MAG: hypothetical protein GX751_02645 [Desulfuromonadaceae bacterium]|nr:hypothetical protein [Desulfuromonadaceae bacterium]